MRRASTKQVPTEKEIEPVLPNKPQRQMAPMQGLRKLQAARKQTGMGGNLNNLLGLQARQSPWGGQGNG